MYYLWTEDAGAGLHFWKLVNQLFFDNALIVQSMGSNQGILDAVSHLIPYPEDIYYIAFDLVSDNQDIRNKYRLLRALADRHKNQIILLDIVCFEYLILSFKKLISWTGTRKADKIKMREEVLAAIENHSINLSKIKDKKTLQYIEGFKRFSTERIMKSLTLELTENEKWSVGGLHMGECWYMDCCVSGHSSNVRCGKPELKDGNERMRLLIKSEAIQKVLKPIIDR